MNPSTISAVAQPTINNFNWLSLTTNPLVIAIVSSGVLGIVISFIFKFIFRLGETNFVIKTAVLDITQLKNDVKKLLSHVDIMRTHLVDSGGLQSGLFAPGSPLKLLSKGEEILDASGFKKIYRDNKKWFTDEIIKYNVKNDSDIDEASYKLILKNSNEKKFLDYKEIAFQNGIPLEILVRILSIYLRDQLIKEILSDPRS